jgi:hypothetical protein
MAPCGFWHVIIMLADLYIEALLVDPDLADQVWELWNANEITDEVAQCAWWLIALVIVRSSTQSRH